MLSNIPEECLQQIFYAHDIDSLFSISKSNRYLRDNCYLFLGHEYQSLIISFKNNQHLFKVSDLCLEYLKDRNLSSQINIFIRLMARFRVGNSYGQEEVFWVNKLRFQIKNIHGVTFYNLINKYLGLGYDYSLWSTQDGKRFWLDFQGGSNGYDYDANVKRVRELDHNSIFSIPLEEAFKRLLVY